MNIVPDIWNNQRLALWSRLVVARRNPEEICLEQEILDLQALHSGIQLTAGSIQCDVLQCSVVQQPMRICLDLEGKKLDPKR